MTGVGIRGDPARLPIDANNKVSGAGEGAGTGFGEEKVFTICVWLAWRCGQGNEGFVFSPVEG
ncbi:MAG: hypothetical protein NC924_01340 [Candidatus Omnitrophica bacterium]|nr:hypothetical protein [Candidatus Omnitrophota bacterium]